MARLHAFALIALLICGSAGAQPATGTLGEAEPPAVAAIVARARSAAGAEWTEALEFFCGGGTARPNRPDDPEIEPTRVFDNLYAIGRTSTVVWAITTRDGIVLIDAGYPDQLETVLLPGMRALGLDPADVKYVLLGHGHADHFGGAVYFQQRGARVGLSAADWDVIEAEPLPGTGLPPPERDLIINEGAPIVLGGVEVTPVLVPGHTPGSVGYVFEVTDGARTHTAALFGGSILLVGRIPNEGLELYVRSIEHFAAVTRALGVDVEVQNHPLYDGFPTKLDRLAAREPGAGHPFVVGAEAYQRFLTVMAECTRAELERRNAAAR